MCFRRMQIPTRGIHTECPPGTIRRNLFPGGQSQRKLQEGAHTLQMEIPEAVMALIEPKMRRFRIFLKERQKNLRRAVPGAKRVGLRIPVQISRGARIPMKMMLGLLMITIDLHVLVLDA